MNIGLVFKYYLPHVRRYLKSKLLVLACYGLATVGVGIVGPLLYKRIIDIVSQAPHPTAASATLTHTMLLIGVNLFIVNVFYRIGDYAMTYLQSRALKDIADDAFRRTTEHSYEFFSSTFTGSLVAKARRYVSAFETIDDQFTFGLWMGGLRLVFAVSVLLYHSAVLGGIFLGWLALYVWITVWFTRRKIMKDVATAEQNSKVTGTLADVITNMLNVKMFAAGVREHERFQEVTREEMRRRSAAWNFQNLQFLFQGYFVAIFEFVGMFAVVYLWTRGVISAGTILLMQIYIFTSFDIVWNLGRNMARTLTAVAEAKEMVDIFETPVHVSDPRNPETPRIAEGAIEFHNISFAYRGTRKVFDGFSLTIAPGEKVGLVGPSGSGKTTVTKLLLRFSDVQEGEILIDGQNIARLSQDDLRRSIAYVPQDPILFHRSLRENIAYARPGAPDGAVRDAAQRAHADEFIVRLPHGYDTFVGERGVKLSGGERQRVAIARAMLKDAPILILDEATSSLDSLSEKRIQAAFDELMRGRTTIVIAHRLSTIQKMDRIIVLDHGRIAEEGSHATLLVKRGLYYKLWKQQSHGFVGE